MNRRTETFIGSRDTGYTSRQYNDEKNAALYAERNPDGLRGGLTPAERVEIFDQLAPGSKVFEIGFGPGYDAIELRRKGHTVTGGDVSTYYIERLRARGLEAIYFDAATDPIPDGFDAVYAHLSLFHIRPNALVKLLASCRDKLRGPRAFYASFLDGYGHETSERNEGFRRYFNYYPRERLGKMCEREGLNIKSLEKVTAFNGSEFWHVLGVFTSEYEGGSYGEKELHPFGDTIWVPNTLYRKNLINDLVTAQVKDGLLPAEAGGFIKAGEKAFYHKWIGLDEMAKEINREWAKGLTGQDVNIVMQHAKDYFNQQPVGPLIEAALAICNNNGFSNTLIGYEPSWVLKVISELLGMDYVSSVQWRTAPGTQFTGKITGGIYYVDNTANPKAAVLRLQSNLRRKLNSDRKRLTVGVGQSRLDENFIAETDFPILASHSEENKLIAEKRGFFTDKEGKYIYADSKRWNRWAVPENEEELAKLLNMITSGRYPVQPNLSNYILTRLAWECPNNTLNKDFYKANQEVEVIIE